MNEMFYTDMVKIAYEINIKSAEFSVITFYVEVSEFKGKGVFYLMECDIRNYLNCIKDLNKNLSGECLISDSESTNFIRLYFNKKELFLEGSLSIYNDLLFKFNTKVDQTILNQFISALSGI